MMRAMLANPNPPQAVFTELSWQPAGELQCQDRNRRLGTSVTSVEYIGLKEEGDKSG